jgi:hypothetical protein
VAAGQLGAQPFFSQIHEKQVQLLLEAQEHKKYAQTTPLDDGVSSLSRFLVDPVNPVEQPLYEFSAAINYLFPMDNFTLYFDHFYLI